MKKLINKSFNKFFLDPLAWYKDIVEAEIIPKANRKIRNQDVGRRKEFDQLLLKYMETYERKKIEEADYKEKIKKAKKRPGIPLTSKTAVFRRFQPSE